jgi:hypothetical protein
LIDRQDAAADGNLGMLLHLHLIQYQSFAKSGWKTTNKKLTLLTHKVERP